MGGFFAVAWTDLVQGLLTVVFSFLLLPFLFDAIGGYEMIYTHDHPHFTVLRATSTCCPTGRCPASL